MERIVSSVILASSFVQPEIQLVQSNAIKTHPQNASSVRLVLHTTHNPQPTTHYFHSSQY